MELEDIFHDELEIVPLTVRHETAAFDSKNDDLKI